MYCVIDDTATTAIFIRRYNSESEKLYDHIANLMKQGNKISKKDRHHLQ